MDKFQFARLVSWITVLMGDRSSMTFDQINCLNDLVQPISPVPAPHSYVNLNLLFDAMIAGKKIEAIREHRMLTGMGLKESKDEVERLMNCFGK
jgi:hypothetical protein